MKKFEKNNKPGAGKKSNTHVKELIIRSLAVSVVHVFMEFIPFLLPFVRRDAWGIAIFSHFSLTIPFVLTIFIFTDWKERLFPWKNFSSVEQREDKGKKQNCKNSVGLANQTTLKTVTSAV